METAKTQQQQCPMKAEPQKEHRWLQGLVGDWIYEGEATTAPDQPPEKFMGTESVRSIGNLWILAEGQGEMPGGGAVARAFAREGAKVFLAGHTLATLDAVAGDIAAAGGAAETAQVDALNEQAILKHISELAEKAGGVDISFNAISIEDIQGTPLIEMALEDFARPITIATRTPFLTD